MSSFFLRSFIMTTWVFAFVALLAGATWFFTHPSRTLASHATLLKSHLSMENLLRGFTAFLGTVLALYWSWNDNFRKQWYYCCDLYNDCLKETHSFQRSLLKNALAIDLVVVDMWAHRSFSDFFRGELEDAIARIYDVEPGRRSEIFARLNANELTEDEARRFLEKHQSALLHERDEKEEERSMMAV